MANMRLILGMSVCEKPEAYVFRFDDGKFTGSYARSAFSLPNPRESSYWERKSYPEKVVKGLARKIEKEGFAVSSNSEGIPIHGIGISMPGNIDSTNYIVRNIARIKLARDPLNKYFGELLPNIDIKRACALTRPLSMHNDVTCMARAESYLRFDDAFKSFVYLYVGTGVNVGVIVNGEPLPSAMHPELGHLRARLEGKPQNWTLEGADNFCRIEHLGCFESILAEAAMRKRFDLDKMLKDKGAFQVERAFVARCIAQLCEIIVLAFAPQKLVVGGYVDEPLLDAALHIFKDDLKGYPLYLERQEDNFIELSPNLAEGAAAFGAALLAFQKMAQLEND